jgi:hypothetical protein
MAQVRFALPPYRNASTALAVSVVVASVVWKLAADSGLVLYFMPGLVLRGQVWQLATWIWAARPDTMSVLFSALIIWLTGGSLEYSWGRKRFLQFVIITLTAAALLTLGLAALAPQVGSVPFFGAQVMSSIVWVGYGCSIWRGGTNIFGFPVTGRNFALLGVLLVALNGIFGGLVTIIPEAFALAMTFAYALYGWPTQAWVRFRSRQLDRDLKRRSSHLRPMDGGRRGRDDDFLN